MVMDCTYILSILWYSIFIAFCVLTHATVKYLWKYYITHCCIIDSELSDLPLPPGTLGYPLIGETIEFIRKNANFYKIRQQKYGRIYMTHVLGRPTIRITGAHNLRKILIAKNSDLCPQWPTSIRKVLGPYALSMMHDYQEHKDRKRLLLNLFLPDALNGYIPIIRSSIRHYLDIWCQKGRIYGYPECRNLAFTISTKCLTGFDCSDEMADELSAVFETMIRNMFSLPVELPGFGLYKALKAKRYLIQRVEENINNLQSRPVDDNKNVSALDLLIREEGEESRYKTCESIVELMFASHDTTSSAFCSCLMYLGRYPHVLSKIRQEIGTDDLSENITVRDLEKYTYCYNVIKEVLRITPPVGAAYRKVQKSFSLEGYKIPKGWTIAYGIRDTHHSSPVYTNAETFDPERWESLPNFERVTSDNIEDMFQFVSFGGGPRTCIGKEFAKLVLRLFILEVCKNYDWTLENKDADLYYIPVPRAVDNLPLSIQKLNKENDN